VPWICEVADEPDPRDPGLPVFRLTVATRRTWNATIAHLGNNPELIAQKIATAIMRGGLR
jgi:hypothetical protein